MSAVPSASPVPAVVGTIALATTTLTTIGAALLGTPYELGISLAALAAVVIGLRGLIQ